jgi:hypothetical protein
VVRSGKVRLRGSAMTDAVHRLLQSFDALPDTEKQAALLEILHRTRPEGDASAAELHAAADELFTTLDAEEAARATC